MKKSVLVAVAVMKNNSFIKLFVSIVGKDRIKYLDTVYIEGLVGGLSLILPALLVSIIINLIIPTITIPTSFVVILPIKIVIELLPMFEDFHTIVPCIEQYRSFIKKCNEEVERLKQDESSAS